MSPQSFPPKRQSLMVCLIGLDGSGKTKHALALQNVLRRKHFQCVLITPRSALIKHEPSFVRRLIGQRGHLSLRNLTASFNKQRSLLELLKVLPLKLALSLFYIGYGFVTHLVYIKPYLRKKGIIVICDRYFYDLFYNLWRYHSIYLTKFLSSPNLTFVLDTPVSQALKRMHSVEDKNVPQEYYEQLRRWYILLSRQLGFIIVDTSSDFEAASNTMVNQVLDLYKSLQ